MAGFVHSVRNYGMFVNVGENVIGLLHKERMGPAAVPAIKYQPGDEIVVGAAVAEWVGTLSAHGGRGALAACTSAT